MASFSQRALLMLAICNIDSSLSLECLDLWIVVSGGYSMNEFIISRRLIIHIKFHTARDHHSTSTEINPDLDA